MKIKFVILVALNVLFFCRVTLGTPANSTKITALSRFVTNIESGKWVEIPNSKIPLLKKEQIEALVPGAFGVLGSAGVLDAWNGAAFDPEKLKWYFHGGGHKAYGGNEVYMFDFNTFAWAQLTKPALLDGRLTKDNNGDGEMDACPEPRFENGPPATHHYDAMLVDPQTGYIHLLSGLTFCNPSGNLENTWVFNPEQLKWKMYPGIPGGGIGGKSDIIPETGEIILIKNGTTFLYNPKNNSAVKKGYVGALRWPENGTFDPDSGNFITFTCDKVIHVNPHTGGIKEVKVDLSSTIDGCSSAMGFTYHPPSKKIIIWTEGKEVYQLDHFTGDVRAFTVKPGPTPTRKYGRVYDKWVYIPQHDVFAAFSNNLSGVWLWKMSDQSQLHKPKILGSLNTFMAGLKSSIVPPGDYNRGSVIKANDAVFTMNDVHTVGGTVKGKAVVVNQGDNVELIGWECEGASVSSNNGACIRNEGGTIKLRSVYFHDNQQGFLGRTGDLLVFDSLFERNGLAGRAHQIYFGGNNLIVKNSKFLSAVGEGHGIKTGAKKSLIEGVTIDGTGGKMSRNIDVYNGGELIIRNSTLIKSDTDTNIDIIGYDYEARKDFTVNRIILEKNVFVCGKKAAVLRGRNSFFDVEIISKDNQFLGNCTHLPISKPNQ